MNTSATFLSLLNEYLGGSRRLRKGYWQEYKRKSWRLFGVRIRANPRLREAVLERAERRRHAKVRSSLLMEEFVRRDYLLGMIEKDTSWVGAYLPVPVKISVIRE